MRSVSWPSSFFKELYLGILCSDGGLLFVYSIASRSKSESQPQIHFEMNSVRLVCYLARFVGGFRNCVYDFQASFLDACWL